MSSSLSTGALVLTAELNAMGVSPGCSPAGTLSHDSTAGSPEASRRAGRRMRADMAFFFIVRIVCLLLLLAVAVLQSVRLHWGVSLSGRDVRRRQWLTHAVNELCLGTGRGRLTPPGRWFGVWDNYWIFPSVSPIISLTVSSSHVSTVLTVNTIGISSRFTAFISAV